MHIFHKRQGQMEIAQSYFYTDTIQGFKNCPHQPKNKLIDDFTIGWCPQQPKISLNLNMHIFHKRQGQMELAQSYFYTDTIQGFKNLLEDDITKMIIIDSLQYLTKNNIVELYGYVIMPNHIHLLWNFLKPNGKESPAGSFTKYTAHQFKRYLSETNMELLDEFKSNKTDRSFQFWKRDPLAIPISSEENFIQKLDYIHQNPTKEKWKLASLPEDYRWSSARFYQNGIDEFGILTHYIS